MIRRWRRNGIIILSGFIVTTSVHPAARAGGRKPAFSPDRFISRSWTTEDGLPDNRIDALTRTRDGYLWIGTQAGLVRFDGIRFVVFDRLNTSGTVERRVLSLFEDAAGELWVGTAGGGLAAHGEGRWRGIGEREGMLDGHVTAIAGDWKGVLWAGTEYGLHRLDGGGISVYGLDEGLADNRLTSLATDLFGRLWTGTMWGGLARLDGGVFRIYGPREGLGDPRVLSLHAGRDGDLWIGTMKGLYRMPLHEDVIVGVPGTEYYPVTALASGPGGCMLVGTMVEGLKFLDGSGLSAIAAGGLGDCHVRAVLCDDTGEIWVGTDSKGLVRLREREIGAMTVSDGLPEESVYSILEESDGALWIGTENHGLCRMRGGRVTDRWDGSRGLAGDMVRALSLDRFGRLLVGTMDGGLCVLSGGRVERVGGGPASDNVTAVMKDRSGSVWVGTDRGLGRAADGRVEHLQPVAGFDGSTIRTLYESDDGGLYVGTRSGLWRLAGSSFERIPAEHGEPDLDVLSLYEDREDVLWIGTNGGGLRMLGDSGAASFSIQDGLPGSVLHSISAGDSGLFWMSCEDGVFGISRDSLLAYSRGESPILAPVLFDEDDGMPSGSCNGFCAPAHCVSASGDRYYPTKGGVAVFGAARIGAACIGAAGRPPRAAVESIEADGNALDADARVELPHGTDLVEIRFTALDDPRSRKCRFVYRLRGSDPGWSAVHPGRDRSVVYRGLAPGEYEFTVRAVDGRGRWSERTASVDFAILPPFYRTVPFLVSVLVGAMIAGGAAAALSRHRRIRKQRRKYSTSSISEDRLEEACAGLTALMEGERVFLDPDLTLKKLAKRLGIHSNHLSRIVNERHGTSFNNYVNRYRIEEASRMLADPAMRDRSILDIMYDVGFYSKSTFNTAFRKFTGKSPSEFRRGER